MYVFFYIDTCTPTRLSFSGSVAQPGGRIHSEPHGVRVPAHEIRDLEAEGASSSTRVEARVAVDTFLHELGRRFTRADLVSGDVRATPWVVK